MIKSEIVKWIETSGIETSAVSIQMLTMLIEMKIKDVKTQSYREGYLQGKFDKEMEITYGKPQMIEVDSKLEKQYKIDFENESVIVWDKQDNTVRSQMSNHFKWKD